MSKQTIEKLLLEKTSATMMAQEDKINRLMKENDNNEEKVREILSAEVINQQTQEKFIDSITALARDCRFNQETELFEGYDSNGNITSACLTAIDNYANWFAEFSK